MLHTLRFFPSKCRLFHNATFFGSCVIHILYTGVLKFKKKIRRQRVNQLLHFSLYGIRMLILFAMINRTFAAHFS